MRYVPQAHAQSHCTLHDDLTAQANPYSVHFRDICFGGSKGDGDAQRLGVRHPSLPQSPMHLPRPYVNVGQALYSPASWNLWSNLSLRLSDWQAWQTSSGIVVLAKPFVFTIEEWRRTSMFLTLALSHQTRVTDVEHWKGIMEIAGMANMGLSTNCFVYNCHNT